MKLMDRRFSPVHQDCFENFINESENDGDRTDLLKSGGTPGRCWS